MILAETFATNVNWTLIFTGLMAICTFLMWMDSRKNKNVRIDGEISGAPPTNSILARDMKSLGHRVKALEDWRGQLISKLEEDKTEMLQAGEDRASRIHAHIEADRRTMDQRIDALPDRVIATLRNTGAIGGNHD
jgi:hypothetical protein